LYEEKRGCKNKLDLKTFEKSQLSFETGYMTAVLYNKASGREAVVLFGFSLKSNHLV
jgi:hypothetical protein